MATGDKKNAYRIRKRISQTIFKHFIQNHRNSDSLTEKDRHQLSWIADIAAAAVMADDRLNVILKRYGKD